MTIVRLNIVANIAGKGWAALISLAVVPIYLRYLGMESYGLIGVFLSLTGIFSLLDLGLGTALNRQLAQLSAQSGTAQEMRDLLRTLEIVYWQIGIAIGIIVVILAPLIAGKWINPEHLSRDSVTQSLVMMGIVMACQWPRTLYSGGLMGMQRQVALNVLFMAAATALGIGGAVVVAFISPTIQALLAWHIAVALIEMLAIRLLLWRCLPAAPGRPTFSKRLLASLWRFAAGMTGISVTAVVLTQFDKVILSKVLPLEAFGYYSLAWRLAAVVYYMVGPISAAFFPRFSQLAVLNDQQELARLYHRGCQLLSVVVFPVTVVLALFPVEILTLWTGNAAIGATSGTMLGLLVVGTALNGLMSLPYSLQIAYGWTRLVLASNIVAVVVLVPAIYFMSLRYGGVGAALVWLILNSGYVVFMLPLIHRRVLQGHLSRWFLVDVGTPLVTALSVASLWKLTLGVHGTKPWMLLNLAGVSLLTLMAVVLVTPQIRALVVHSFVRRAQPQAKP